MAVLFDLLANGLLRRWLDSAQSTCKPTAARDQASWRSPLPFAFQVRLNCMFSIALWLLLHAFLPKEKGPDDEATPLQSRNKLVFQRTVSDVMAHRRVIDVMTLVD